MSKPVNHDILEAHESAWGWKAGDWPEDRADKDNGAYWNRCVFCEGRFIGHKRRNVCKVCASNRNQTARLTIRLHGTCPKCAVYVELLGPESWDGRGLVIPEIGSAEANAFQVTCPNCNHQFDVVLTK